MDTCIAEYFEIVNKLPYFTVILRYHTDSSQ